MLNGTIKEVTGEPLFAANVLLKSTPETGVTTDFDGEFSLGIINKNDTLVVSYIGYETCKIGLSTIDTGKHLTIVLKEIGQTLEEVLIKAEDPISEQFSVVRMEKMDIYFNPMAQGDPLKAITSLPASTTIDETANPSLRGSDPNRTRVMVNGVPVYNPVRSGQLNNQGFFSLFNPEIIDRQYVYASNPPLTYGNASAGVVEIKTLKNLANNQLQFSTGLSSIGFMLSHKIKEDISFVQAYGNYQFSDAFLGVQQSKLPNVHDFYTKDAGMNFHYRLGRKTDFNSYNYFIDEQFSGLGEEFTYKGGFESANRRFFTVNNMRFYSTKGVFGINSGVDLGAQHYQFGNLISSQKKRHVYTSIGYEWEAWKSINLQLVASHDFSQSNFQDSIPVYYYALSLGAPNQFLATSIQNHILEAAYYAKWEINDKMIVSSGMRANLPVEGQNSYLSYQLSYRYRKDDQQTILLSGGRYFSYSQPSYFAKNYRLLSSYQVALDYSYKHEKTSISAAAYFKSESGEQPIDAFSFIERDRMATFGLEFFWEQNLHRYFKLLVANSFINQKIKIEEESYPGPKDFNYLLKAAIQYINPDLFSLSMIYNTRPGTYYTEVASASLDMETSFFKPIFSTDLLSQKYEDYRRLDLSLSKYIPNRKGALIAFATLSNVFDNHNEKTVLYNKDYSVKHFNYYQFRTIYFGLVWQIGY